MVVVMITGILRSKLMLTDSIETLRGGNWRVPTRLVLSPIRRTKPVFQPLSRAPDRYDIFVPGTARVLRGMRPWVLTLALMGIRWEGQWLMMRLSRVDALIEAISVRSEWRLTKTARAAICLPLTNRWLRRPAWVHLKATKCTHHQVFFYLRSSCELFVVGRDRLAFLFLDIHAFISFTLLHLTQVECWLLLCIEYSLHFARIQLDFEE